MSPIDSRRRAPPGTLIEVLLLCGLLSPAIYVGADVLAARLYPGFSYTDQAVSELFAIGAPTSALVVRLFTLSSALLLAFAAGVWWSSARRRALRLTAVMLACSALDALVLWNFFPMHMRGGERTMTDVMHLVLAANPFVLLSLVFGAVAFRDGLRVYTIATILVLVARSTGSRTRPRSRRMRRRRGWASPSGSHSMRTVCGRWWSARRCCESVGSVNRK